MKQIKSIVRKELDIYFGSPMALIFIAIFLVTTLFSFFWVSGFFARGVADVRPLFQWMPVLLILLISTLTMRQWSEEQQTGTLEVLLTMPIKLWQLVVGKFLAVLALVAVALAFTLSLPLTVALLGNLDIGPVIGGYLAAILMAAAYISIGLFISSRTDNQIVSLLLTAIVCGFFYLIGSSIITGFASTGISEFLRALGTGSRFESIERGVIDLRDLIYYVTLTVIFLTLNVLSLDSKRWSMGLKTKMYRWNKRILAALIIINLIVFNLLMVRVGAARVDLTQGGVYTLSPATQELLGNLQEPLLIRGYFSQETHPALAPIIPQVRDTLEEYKAASNGKIDLEFVDPLTNPDAETEANQVYGIRPTPLQVTDRGKTSVINAYVNILIRYGDQNTTLNLLDMIDVTNTGNGQDVRFRNLEYDLTSNIQKVVYGFQNIDSIFASVQQPIQFTLYYTPSTLPDELKKVPDTINTLATAMVKQANGKLNFKMVDVSQANSGVDLNQLAQKYQIQPVSAGLLSNDTFYLHMVLESGTKSQVIYPTGASSDTELKTSIESAIKRLSPGSLHVVGLWTPRDPQAQQGGQSLHQYNTVNQALSQNFDVRTVDLTSGQISTDIDALVIVAPKDMSPTEQYAVDQYLMRGGSVFVAAGNFEIAVDQNSGSLVLNPTGNGLQEILASYGITVEKQMVLDTQNAPFPVQTQRNVGGQPVSQVQAVDYPYFIDIRSNAMDRNSSVTNKLTGVVLNWASPITVDKDKTKGDQVTTLLTSTSNAWVSANTNPNPNLDLYPNTGFPIEGTPATQTLAVAVQGSFSSYFVGRQLPTANAANPADASGAAAPTLAAPPPTFISKSPDTARLVVVGSSEFLNDVIFNLSQQMGSDISGNNVQLVQSGVGWFLEDSSLGTIQAKNETNHVLKPLTDAEKSRWEVGNYIFALALLIGLGVVWQLRKRNEKAIPLIPLSQLSDPVLVTQAQ